MCTQCGWETWLEDINDLVGRIEDLPERAESFASGVQDKVGSMAAWVETNEHITDPMKTAIDNIGRGVSRWES